LDKQYYIEKELIYLGLLDKAREIYSELGEKAVLSYIKSSHRLLSKVYHPDLNPNNKEKAKVTQQRLNRFSHFLSRLTDEELVVLLKKGMEKKGQRKKKILIVEDESSLQELFRDILLIEGYAVSVAEDGCSGYEEFCRFMPDLVFTDIVMPEMSGLELVRKIRDVNPQTKVIFVSGFFGLEGLKRELDEEILRYGYGTLPKPFKISEMLELVRTYVYGFHYRKTNINVYA